MGHFRILFPPPYVLVHTYILLGSSELATLVYEEMDKGASLSGLRGLFFFTQSLFSRFLAESCLLSSRASPSWLFSLIQQFPGAARSGLGWPEASKEPLPVNAPTVEDAGQARDEKIHEKTMREERGRRRASRSFRNGQGQSQAGSRSPPPVDLALLLFPFAPTPIHLNVLASLSALTFLSFLSLPQACRTVGAFSKARNPPWTAPLQFPKSYDIQTPVPSLLGSFSLPISFSLSLSDVWSKMSLVGDGNGAFCLFLGASDMIYPGSFWPGT